MRPLLFLWLIGMLACAAAASGCPRKFPTVHALNIHSASCAILQADRAAAAEKAQAAPDAMEAYRARQMQKKRQKLDASAASTSQTVGPPSQSDGPSFDSDSIIPDFSQEVSALECL
jgi:hypothetical protein